MTEKQQQLLFDKGITNVPSDALCSDNALEESLGLVYDNGEHRVIQKPVDHITSAQYRVIVYTGIPTFLYIHKFNDEERYIGYINDDIVWGIKDEDVFKSGVGEIIQTATYTSSTKVTSIGKTLIIANEYGIRYYLWTKNNNDQDVYQYLGDAFPRPEVEFKLTGRNNNVASEEISCTGIIYEDGRFKIVLGQQQAWNDAIVGLYSKLRKKVWQKKKFHSSFCVRAALELYDGTYYHISNPILMVNQFAAYGVAQIRDSSYCLVSMEQFGQELQYKFSQDYTKWSDIIKNVVLFVTKEFSLFDTSVDATITYNGISGGAPRFYFMSGNSIYSDPKTTTTTDSKGDTYTVLVSNPDSDLDNTLKDGLYYKLCEIGLIGDGSWHDSSDHFDTHTIENITTQPQMGEDDYYSHCPLVAGMLYSYNSRLNIANVSRGFFDGFDFFMPFDNASPSTYEFLVTIRTDKGDITVSHTKLSYYQKQGIYFYYPDSRAIHVVIKKGGTQILNTDLTEHPTLNGAYYFAGISPTMDEPSSASGTIPTPSSSTFELLPNYVIQSEVNNPFVFKAAGYFKVGTGKVIGMSSITQALSEGQFGQFPLLVFSESGIWALSVSSTGYYDSIHPMSREVCNNPKSITQTDGAVFFTSDKGLMVVVGNQVKCASEQMSGKTLHFSLGVAYLGDFNVYLKNAIIAYDYRDSLLWIFNSSYLYCYVYSIKSSTFARYFFRGYVSNVLNNYPDYLIQNSSDTNKVLSLLERSDINTDSAIYDGLKIVTRPMKFENALALKSIMQITHIKDFKRYNISTVVDGQTVTVTTSGTITIRIFASNNLADWVELTSLRGIPWKYYRFYYEFNGLKATDRFSGTVIVTQERRTDKLR